MNSQKIKINLEKMLRFKDYRIYYDNKYILKFLLTEIMKDEIYRFSSSSKSPTIIDCGSNIGLSILYFKMLYPTSNIIAFEPHDRNFEILTQNISSNKITDVELYKLALSDTKSEDCKFWSDFRIGGDTLSGTIIEDLSHLDNFSETHVKADKLSHYITEPVDFLKLDIEGAEVNVLRDISSKLHLVNEIFVEVHSIGSLKESVVEIKKILEDHDFSVSVLGNVFSGSNLYEYIEWFENSGIELSSIKAKRK